jgi:DNA mismatch repair protein MSH4
VRNLELLTNARTGESKGSLFGVMHHTRTTVGTRLLRSNILSPCNDLPTLHARLDAVDALLGAEAMFSVLGGLLPKLADLDALLSFFVTTPK